MNANKTLFNNEMIVYNFVTYLFSFVNLNNNYTYYVLRVLRNMNYEVSFFQTTTEIVFAREVLLSLTL